MIPPTGEMPAYPPAYDARLSAEFSRRLTRYMGVYDPADVFAGRWHSWYLDHTGRRSQWFRDDLVKRIEHHRPLRGLRVLDFGCGTGSSTVVFAEHGASVVGAETEQISVDIAVQRARDLGIADRTAFVRIPYLNAPGDRLPFGDAAFDLCTIIGVLEHMKSPERRICADEIARVVKPGGGVFIFDTPNRSFPKDHHTTHLWLVGWLPESMARRYAIWRKRFDPRRSFRRYGGNGVSRLEIDRLFPPDPWQVVYDKAADEIRNEYAGLVREPYAGAVRRAMDTVFSTISRAGARPSYWTSSHAIGLEKVRA